MRGKGDVHEARAWLGESEGMNEKRRMREDGERESEERGKGKEEITIEEGGRRGRGGVSAEEKRSGARRSEPE